MSSSIPIHTDKTAPTPQNTPHGAAAPIQGLSRPTVPDIAEEGVDEEISTLGVDGLRSAMLGMVQGRLAGLLGSSSGYIASLPAPVRRQVEGLKGVQIQQNELQNAFKREALELERKYLELQKPLYARRQAIISGASPASEDEIAVAAAADKVEAEEDGEEYEPVPDASASTDDDVKGIPDFWATALQNHPGLTELVTERDAEALKHLKDITLGYLPKAGEEGAFEGKPGFTLTFHWDADANPFFSNEALTKTYIYEDKIGYSGDFIYSRAVGSEIKWKDEDKDLTRDWEIKKQRNKNTNRTRIVRKSHPAASFFNFFSPPVMPSEEELDAGDVDAEDLAEIEDKLEVDYQIGEDLKEKIIPRAVDYFTGKALAYELDSDDEGMFDEEDDEDEFDSDEDDDEEDADSRMPPRRRWAASSSNANGNPEECKQQ
ncbi:NAP-domain-containing protein [Mycena kentingensis (nom. inval.)]|nr:NAP-domain-containing protein [Mycena kentingensis (nom. inval.)]